MEVQQHVEVLAAEGERFAQITSTQPPDTAVPTCPGWAVRDLVRHLGLVHLWAAAHVADPHDEPDHAIELAHVQQWWPELAVAWPRDEDLVGWYRGCNHTLLDVLRAASPDVPAWTFLPAPSPLAMWARRQACETLVHRVDAELAAGTPPAHDPAVATDAVDEMLQGFVARPWPVATPAPRTLAVVATDTDEAWLVTLAPDGVTTTRLSGADPSADLVLRGPAGDLLQLLWNRPRTTAVALDGDATVLDLYADTVSIRWS